MNSAVVRVTPQPIEAGRLLHMFHVNHVFLFKPSIYLIRATQQAVCSVVLRRFAAPSNQLLPQSLTATIPGSPVHRMS